MPTPTENNGIVLADTWAKRVLATIEQGEASLKAECMALCTELVNFYPAYIEARQATDDCRLLNFLAHLVNHALKNRHKGALFYDVSFDQVQSQCRRYTKYATKKASRTSASFGQPAQVNMTEANDASKEARPEGGEEADAGKRTTEPSGTQEKGITKKRTREYEVGIDAKSRTTKPRKCKEKAPPEVLLEVDDDLNPEERQYDHLKEEEEEEEPQKKRRKMKQAEEDRLEDVEEPSKKMKMEEPLNTLVMEKSALESNDSTGPPPTIIPKVACVPCAKQRLVCRYPANVYAERHPRETRTKEGGAACINCKDKKMKCYSSLTGSMLALDTPLGEHTKKMAPNSKTNNENSTTTVTGAHTVLLPKSKGEVLVPLNVSALLVGMRGMLDEIKMGTTDLRHALDSLRAQMDANQVAIEALLKKSDEALTRSWLRDEQKMSDDFKADHTSNRQAELLGHLFLSRLSNLDSWMSQDEP